jgi:hypothetical protein
MLQNAMTQIASLKESPVGYATVQCSVFKLRLSQTLYVTKTRADHLLYTELQYFREVNAYREMGVRLFEYFISESTQRIHMNLIWDGSQ